MTPNTLHVYIVVRTVDIDMPHALPNTFDFAMPLHPTSYDVTGERDAGLELDLTTENLDARSQLEARMGHVLVVAMAGCAAELLRLGDSRGGGEDIPRALEILRLSRVGSHKRKAFLRWALLKAIVLLRLHRDALDSTTELMLQGADLPEIIEQIESSRIEEA